MIMYTSVGENPSITVTIFILKSFYCNVFRLVYNDLESRWQGTKEELSRRTPYTVLHKVIYVYVWDLTLQYH